MDPTITIQNMTGEAQDVVLPHNPVCVRLGRCLCDRATAAPASLVVPPHGRLADLPPEFLEAPALRQLCKVGRLAVRISTPAKVAKAPTGAIPRAAAAAQVEDKRSAGNRKGKH